MAEVVKPSAPATSAPPTPPQPPESVLTREQKLAQLCETQYLRVQELQGANFSHRGYCTKCGWQSMQHSAKDAHDMTTRHVMVHWRDVVGML